MIATVEDFMDIGGVEVESSDFGINITVDG